MAFESLKEISQEQKMRELALAREKFIRDQISIQSEMEQRGLQRGLELGLKALVPAYLNAGMSKEEIVKNLVSEFEFSEDQAETYYRRFSVSDSGSGEQIL